MAATNSPSTTATLPPRNSLPFDFAVRNDNGDPVIFIEDGSSAQTLTLEISYLGGQTPPPKGDLEIRFRPGTLAAKCLQPGDGQIALQDPPTGWSMTGPTTNSNSTVSFLFAKTGGVSLTSQETLSFKLVNVLAAAGTGARATRVELLYTWPFTGFQEQQLSVVNHSGFPHLPVHVGFVGSNRVLNDGESSNQLTLRLSNVSEPSETQTGMIPFKADPEAPSKLILSFDCGPPVKEWTLGTCDQVQAITVKVSIPGFDVQQMFLGESPEWIITPNASFGPTAVLQLGSVLLPQAGATATSQSASGGSTSLLSHILEALTPLVKSAPSGKVPEGVQETAQALSEGYIDISIDGITTATPTGLTNLYLRYENIPGYWDGQFVCQIEKAPLVFEGGKVGIGTTAPATTLHVESTEPGAPAEVLRIQSVYKESGDGPGLGFQCQALDNPWTQARIRSAEQQGYRGQLIFETNQNSLGKPNQPTTEAMRIDGNGAVGIGTTTPASTLAVAGSAAIGTGYAPSESAPPDGLFVQGRVGIGSTTAPADPTFKVIVDPQGEGGMLIGNSDTSTGGNTSLQLKISAEQGGYADIHAIQSSGSAYGDLVLNKDGGSVGIGISTPAHALDVNGNVNVSGTLWATNVRFRLAGGWAQLASNPQQAKVTFNGNVSAPSDLRLKTNLRGISDPLEKVTQLSGVNYQWSEEGLEFFTQHIEETLSAGPGASDEENREVRAREKSKRVAELAGLQMGLVAQEVEGVVPEVVGVTGDGYKTIDYQHLAALLVEAIKALNEKVEDLSEQLEESRANAQELKKDS